MDTLSGKLAALPRYRVRGESVILDTDLAAFFELDLTRLRRRMSTADVADRIRRSAGREVWLALTSAELDHVASQDAQIKGSRRGARALCDVDVDAGLLQVVSSLRGPVADRLSVELIHSLSALDRECEINRVMAAAKSPGTPQHDPAATLRQLFASLS